MIENHTQPGEIARVSSGITGLDTILRGGFLKGGTYLIVGAPGTGKTILSNQICFHHVAGGGRAIYFSLLAETSSRLLSHLQSLAFFTPEPIGDSLYYLSGYSILEQKGLDGLMMTLRKEIRSRQATLLVIDGLGIAEQIADSMSSWKQFLHNLHVTAEILGCTMLLLMPFEHLSPTQPEQTMVDGVIELTSKLADMRGIRELQIGKIRGSDFLSGRHLFTISTSGVTVYPRTESLLTTLQLTQKGLPPQSASLEPLTRFKTGIGQLDEMLNGGLPASSITIVLGAIGTGKTLLGCHFLLEGVRRGEQGLYFGFYETPAQLLRKTASVGMNLRPAVDQGLLELLWQPPIEDIPDALAQRILETVRKHKVKRLFLDGLGGFQRAVATTERLDLLLTALFTTLRTLDVTTVCSVELPDLFSPSIQTPDSMHRAVALVENILLLRQVELRSHLYRLLSIMNMRESSYDSAIREFRITDHGIEVASTFSSAEAILTGIAHPAGEVELPAEPGDGTEK